MLELVAHPDGGLELRAALGDEHEHLGIELRERVGEVAQRRDPGAMDRLARAPQDAVDGFDRLARGAQTDEPKGAFPRQVCLRCPARAKSADASTRIGTLR